MKHYILFVLLAVSINLFAQQDNRLAPLQIDLEKIDLLEMERIDNKELYKKEMSLRTSGRANVFAHTFYVNQNAEELGTWTNLDDGSLVWRLRISSHRAKSLNLGFSQYKMPKGGSLVIYTPDLKNIMGPFTPSDNEEHEQLWTPVIDGDDIIVEVWLKENNRSQLELELKAVNHDFIGINSRQYMSGSCNLDVICGEEDGWEIVDGYRDIIQSVAFMHLNGSANCTGFLVNNTSEDCTPLFMTADHCGMSVGNAPSLVTYWNFQSPICRQPGSSASGGNGGGVLDDFNSGSTMRATWGPSDFTIVELDDEISPTANAYRAGWNAEETMATSAIAVHHPSNDEKRISFENDPLYLGTWGSAEAPDPNGDHVIVPDWDIGTTEPGSSGSPLFDQDKRVIGQLHGGSAACGNDLYDSYGWFNASWEGGGQANTRLKDWLDPNDTGIMTIGGKDCGFAISAPIQVAEVCAPNNYVYDLEVSDNFVNNVSLSIDGLATGLSATFSNENPAPGETVTLTIGNTSSLDTGTYNIVVDGTDGIETTSTQLTLELFTSIPGIADAVFPVDNSAENSTAPKLQWSDASGVDYEVEIALDMAFTEIVASNVVDNEEWVIINPLDALTTYFWRVKGTNVCGEGAWSSIFTFTTANILCNQSTATFSPIPISPDGTSSISSTLLVSNGGEITDLNVIRVEGEHTWLGDLTLIIESPEGTSVVLLADLCGSEDDFDISFDDQSTDAIPCPYNDGGTYPPAGALSSFNGENPQGTWTFTIQDNANADGGNLNTWGLEICTIPDNSTSINVSQSDFTLCPSDIVDFDVSIGGGFVEPINIEVESDNPDLQVTTPPIDVTPGATLNFVVGASPSIAPGTYTAGITVSDSNESATSTIQVTVIADPEMAGLSIPNDGANDVSVNPSFEWNNPGDLTSIIIRISEDPNFLGNTISESIDGAASIHSLTEILFPETTYYWRIESTNDCGTTLSDIYSFTTESSSGIEGLDNAFFTLMPNPTQGQVLINLSETNSEEISAEVYHISGRLIQHFKIAPGQDSKLINFGDAPTGIYFVKLKYNDLVLINKVVLN